MSRGTYERTPEIREKNRRSAVAPDPCADDCTCGRHASYGGGKPCEPGCTCGKHTRSQVHKDRIREGVKRSRA